MNAKQKYLTSLKDKVGSVMSAPSRKYQGASGARYDSQREVLKKARAYDNAPNFNDDGSVTDAYKMRSAAKAIRERGAR